MCKKRKSFRKNSLDFSLLPVIEGISLIFSIPDHICDAFSDFENTYNRARCAVYFALQISKNTTQILREGYFRAALTEFVSMEETSKKELGGIKHRLITASQNPLLHIMKQLRNLQIHLVSNHLDSSTHTISFHGTDYQLQKWHIQEELTLNDFAELDQRKFYKDTDLQQVIAWFNETQKQWGVHALIRQAVIMYAEELMQKFK
ncbi:MAG: hypothetical protein BWY02_02611 [bacterium ADurb.Bin157]|nr:MAG: hypothetical protein BWY02_02611 [bacterium ADurb.Bin157]